MLTFTIVHGSVYRGIRPQLDRSKKRLGIAFRSKRKEEMLPLCPEWQSFVVQADARRSRLTGGRLEAVQILSCDIDPDKKVLLPVNRRVDQPAQVLVLVRPPKSGTTFYTAATWDEKEINGTVLRDYLPLDKAAGIDLFHGQLSPEGEPEQGGMLLGMCPGSAFRMARHAEGEPAEFIFEWWQGEKPTLRRALPVHGWAGQREAVA